MHDENLNHDNFDGRNENVAEADCARRQLSSFIVFVAQSSRGFLTDARAGSASFSPTADEAVRFPTRQAAEAFLAIGCPSLFRHITIVAIRCDGSRPAWGPTPAWRSLRRR